MKMTRFITGALAAFMAAMALAQPSPDTPIGYVARQSGTISTQNLVPTGTATAGSAVEVLTNGAACIGVEVSNTYTGALSLQGTIGGVTWETAGGTPFTKRSTNATSATIASGGTGNYVVSVQGYYKVRITGLAAMTGSAIINVVGTANCSTGGGSGGGTSDATAANQATQITAEQAIQVSVASIDTKTPASPATAGNQSAIQAPAAPGAATATKSVLLGGVYNSSLPTFTNSQQGAMQVDANGRLLVVEADSTSFTGTCSASCNGTTLGSAVDTSGYGSIEVQMTSAGSGTVTFQCSSDNTNWTTCAGQNISGSASSTIQQTTMTATGQMVFPTWSRYFRPQFTAYTSGTFTIQGYLRRKSFSPFAQPVNVANAISVGTGQAAHGSGISNAPMRVAGRARTSNYTAVANDQTADFQTTTVGVQVVRPWTIPEAEWTYAAASGGISNTTTAVTMVAAAGAGIRNYVSSCQVSSDALGTATELAIRDGAAGTVLWRIKVGTAGISSYHIGFGIPLKSTANTLLEVVTLTASGTGGVYINCQGYQAP